MLGAPALERGYWGVLIRSLANNDTLYAMNARKLMMPASALKTVTLAAAAERLGWDYTYETQIVAEAPVHEGTVEGDLAVLGSGDPSIDERTVASWADQLKAHGILAIAGGVVADGRAFEGHGLGFGWSWGDLPYYYAAPVSAAQFHRSAVDISISPGQAPGDPAGYELSPTGSGLVVENAIRTGPSDGPVEFVAHRFPGSPVVVLDGTVPAGGKPITRSLAVDDPAAFLAAALKEALVARGIAVNGPATARRDTHGNAPVGQALLSHRSAPLRVMAGTLMEVSQNQYAETLLTTMGAQAGTATPEGGLKVVEGVLASWNVPADATVLRDGSGLSRYDYITPETLVQVLTRMHGDPRHSESFFQSLSLSGVTGTLAARMQDTAAFQKVRAKDGSMAGVRSLCGIVSTGDGEPLVFAILANNFAVPGSTITATIDSVMVRLAAFRRTPPSERDQKGVSARAPRAR